MTKDYQSYYKAKKMCKLIIFIFCIITLDSFILTGQTITYDYDNSGNRIKKYIVLQAKGLSSNDTVQKDNLLNNEDEKIVDELNEVKVMIYPNPTQGILNVELSGIETDDTFGYQLYSQSGVLLKYIKSTGNPFSIDFSSYHSGMYILILINKNSRSEWKVFKN